jgi:hypothetical protein
VVVLPTHPWSLASVVAEGNRDALARFWLAAPLDQLESLWAGALGDASRQLIRQLQPGVVFTPDQLAVRDGINQVLQQGGLQQPLAPQLLLAVFLYSPPGLFQVANPYQNLPAWLAAAHQDLYANPGKPAAPEPSTVHEPPAAAAPAQPSFGLFPASLQELVGNRIQLNRILGLSNLYYIDPEDQEILQELVQLRSQLADLISQAPEVSLEAVWATDLGDRYWAMVRSGVQKEPLAPADEARKQRSTQALSPAAGGGFGTPGALNAFLVAMLFYEPGSMRVDGAEHKLPGWLLPHYQQIFAESLAAPVS